MKNVVPHLDKRNWTIYSNKYGVYGDKQMSSDRSTLWNHQFMKVSPLHRCWGNDNSYFEICTGELKRDIMTHY